MRSIAIAVCLAACWRGDAPVVEPPRTDERPAQIAALTERDAQSVIAKLPPGDRARLQELWYMYDLQDVIGDEDDAERLMRRLEKELGKTRFLDPKVVQEALARSQKILTNVLHANLGKYEKSDRVAQPILEIILQPEELEKRMFAFPIDVAAAWFVIQYYSDAHYHNYRMHNRMFDLLGKYGGRRGLTVIADRLRAAVGDSDGASGPDDWNRGVGVARKILGPDFKRWYNKTLGRDFSEDRRTRSRTRTLDD